MENQHGQQRFVTVLFLLRWDAGGAGGEVPKRHKSSSRSLRPLALNSVNCRTDSWYAFVGKKRLVDFESF